MDFKKIASGAATFFNRAVQYTEERLGQADKTDLDAHVEQLLGKIDRIQMWTERIVKNTDCVMQPNPALRMEGFVLESLDRRKPYRLNTKEDLGQTMVDGGHAFGVNNVYGDTLLKCGQAEQRLGREEKEFGTSVAKYYLEPLRNFLDHDLKNFERERKIMENRRLDLDMHRSQLRRARSDRAREQADEEVAAAQREFDRQQGVVRHLGEGILTSQEQLRKCVVDFVEHQTVYFAKCHQHLMELSRQISSDSNWSASTMAAAAIGDGEELMAETVKTKQARVLYDYQAGDSTELNLQADELIEVHCASSADAEIEMWLIAERNGQRGKVPSAYVEVID